MTDPTARFSDRVKNYALYRPNYPGEIVGHLKTHLGLTPNSVVADIGSGTGISSKLFLGNGNRVFGVEPNAEMRKAAESDLADFPNFISTNGKAEKTNLDSDGIDLITAFQAFHWFDNEDTLREFRRILKPNGSVALIWNERQLDSNQFLVEYERLLIEFGTDYQSIRHDRISKERIEGLFGTEFTKFECGNTQFLEFQGFIGRTLSASYVPERGQNGHDAMLERLTKLFELYEEQGRIQIHYDTKVFYGQI